MKPLLIIANLELYLANIEAKNNGNSNINEYEI